MDYIVHSGILNMKWGVRNGPPYPLTNAQRSPSERKANKPSIYGDKEEIRKARNEYYTAKRVTKYKRKTAYEKSMANVPLAPKRKMNTAREDSKDPYKYKKLDDQALREASERMKLETAFLKSQNELESEYNRYVESHKSVGRKFVEKQLNSATSQLTKAVVDGGIKYVTAVSGIDDWGDKGKANSTKGKEKALNDAKKKEEDMKKELLRSLDAAKVKKMSDSELKAISDRINAENNYINYMETNRKNRKYAVK